MAKFKLNPLKWLDGLYDFVGGMSGLRDFCLEGSVQPVHDVSDMAMYATALGRNMGYWYIWTQQVHSGAGEIADTVNPFAAGSAVVNNYPATLDEGYRIWVIDGWGNVTANFNYAQLEVDDDTDMLGPKDATGTQPNRLLRNWDNTTQGYLSMAAPSVGSINPPFQPVFLPHGGKLVFRSACTGAGTVNMLALIWVGKVGATPPGM